MHEHNLPINEKVFNVLDRQKTRKNDSFEPGDTIEGFADEEVSTNLKCSYISYESSEEFAEYIFGFRKACQILFF